MIKKFIKVKELNKIMKNPNHPKKGSTIAVEPIRLTKDIKLIKKHLQDSPRNLCLFILGINTNLRASDLLQIQVDQVKNLPPERELLLKEKKTGKSRRINLNKACTQAIQNLLQTKKYNNDDDFLFQSKRKGQVLTVPSLSQLVKG